MFRTQINETHNFYICFIYIYIFTTKFRIIDFLNGALRHKKLKLTNKHLLLDSQDLTKLVWNTNNSITHVLFLSCFFCWWFCEEGSYLFLLSLKNGERFHGFELKRKRTTDPWYCQGGGNQPWWWWIMQRLWQVLFNYLWITVFCFYLSQ